MLALPIPDYAQVVVPAELIETSAMTRISDLGPGIRFGSCHVQDPQEYDMTRLTQTGELLRRTVLAFDAWIHNTDRTFSRPLGTSGNPNLLWASNPPGLAVIDHNNAFLPDDLFNPADFARHVFADDRGHFSSELKRELMERMNTAVINLDSIMDEIPREWRFEDQDFSVPISLTTATVKGILTLPMREPPRFWGMIGEEAP